MSMVSTFSVMREIVNRRPSRSQWFFHGTLLPVIAGCLMLCETFIPWLKDPLGSTSNAWQLRIDLGWQFHMPVLNYGLLELCCALYIFLLAFARFRSFRGSRFVADRYSTAAFFCLVPVFLFFLQFLCADMSGIDHLAQQHMHSLLIRLHFGYKSGQQLISIAPLLLDISTLQGRLALLLDLGTAGLLLPCICACLLVECKRSIPRSARKVPGRSGARAGWRRPRFWLGMGLLVLFVILGRAPASVFCQYLAKSQLSSGNYSSALQWLDTARFLNPSLEQVPFYHRERGQALYFLNTHAQSVDSMSYLAYTYRQQSDYIDSYQQLFPFWQASGHESWLTDELDVSLVNIVEGLRPLDSKPAKKLKNETASLLWLHLLTQLEPTSAYGHYMTARVLYNLYDYSGSTSEMSSLIQMNLDTDILSSAYTYIALNKAGQGDFVDERKLLLQAVALDPNYYNDTARQELSGLR